MFDLPVDTPQKRRAYSKFREFLLENGFSMAQYSIYFRVLAGKPAVESHVKRIKKAIPSSGKVDILTITDKQYENIISFTGNIQENKESTQQFILF
ncbi:MAG: CRISPR-associated endonuclease Cas2 [Alphaproteobacteria bacterium]|nr:CRISPR-associated endonuclease Cas2 [Alphaproteobacteria bacterium]